MDNTIISIEGSGTLRQRRKNKDSWKQQKPTLMTIQSGDTLHPEQLASQETATHTTAMGQTSSSSSLSGDDRKSGNSGSSSAGCGGKRSRARLKRLAFVGFGGTLGGIVG
eukprot:1481029-Ditylum_brightwellii.AAC.1